MGSHESDKQSIIYSLTHTITVVTIMIVYVGLKLITW